VSTTKVDVTSCDLCGYGGAYTRPQDFHRILDVDLCHWCAAPGPVRAGATLSSGRHVVTFTEDSWSCSCGQVYRRPIFLMPNVRDAVPNIVLATANNHVQS